MVTSDCQLITLPVSGSQTEWQLAKKSFDLDLHYFKGRKNSGSAEKRLILHFSFSEKKPIIYRQSVTKFFRVSMIFGLNIHIDDL